MAIRLTLTFLGLWCTFRLGPVFISLFAPFLLALLMAWVLAPAVSWLHKRLGWPRKLLSLLLLLLVFALVCVLVWGLWVGVTAEVAELAGNWEALMSTLQETVEGMGDGLSKLLNFLPSSAQMTAESMTEQFFQWLDTAIPRCLSSAVDILAGAVRALPSFAVAVLAFVMAAYFLAADWPSLRARAAGCLPEGSLFFLRQVRRAFRAGFGGYLKTELLLSVGVFFLLLAGFLVIREPYAILLAFLLAVLDFIPLIGSGTVMLPWAVWDLLTGSVRHGVEIIVVWSVIALFRRFAEPRILGSQTGLSPIVSLISVYVGMRLAGVCGMLFAPVLCLVVLNVVRAGVLDNVWRDVRLAAGDVVALLAPEDDGG